MTNKIIINLASLTNLMLLDQRRLVVRDGVVIYSPICPDYHFKKIMNPLGQAERVHDFDGMGVKKGIVYEKLMTRSKKLFERLEKSGVEYEHLLLVADVEKTDNIILQKLGIGQEEFIKRCKKTCNAINADLKERGFEKSNCMLMGEYFREVKYGFEKNIKKIEAKLDKDSRLIRQVQRVRLPLHQFWFGLGKQESEKRSVGEAAMYASFGHCPEISGGIILCADSEILSKCYNLLKARNKYTPVIYLKGNY